MIYNQSITRATNVTAHSKFTAKAKVTTKNEDFYAISVHDEYILLLSNDITVTNTNPAGYSNQHLRIASGIWFFKNGFFSCNDKAKKVSVSYTAGSKETLYSMGFWSDKGDGIILGKKFLYSCKIIAANSIGDANAAGMAFASIYTDADIVKNFDVSASAGGANAAAQAYGFTTTYDYISADSGDIDFHGVSGNVTVTATSKAGSAQAFGISGNNVIIQDNISGKITASATGSTKNARVYAVGIDANEWIDINNFNATVTVNSKNQGTCYAYGLWAGNIQIVTCQQGTITVSATSTDGDANSYGLHAAGSITAATFSCSISATAVSKNSESWVSAVYAGGDIFFFCDIDKAVNVSGKNVRATKNYATRAWAFCSTQGNITAKDITAPIQVVADNEGDAWAYAISAAGTVDLGNISGNMTVKATNKEHYGTGTADATMIYADGFSVGKISGKHTVTATDGSAVAAGIYTGVSDVFIDDMGKATLNITAKSKNGDATATGISSDYNDDLSGDLFIDADGLNFGKMNISATAAKGYDAFAGGIVLAGSILESYSLSQAISGNITVKSNGTSVGITAADIQVKSSVNLVVTGAETAIGYYLTGTNGSQLTLSGAYVSAAVSDKNSTFEAYAIMATSYNSDQLVTLENQTTLIGNVSLGNSYDTDMIVIESGSKLKGALIDVEGVLLDVSDSSKKNVSFWDIKDSPDMTETTLIIDFDYGMTGDFLLCTKEAGMDWDDALNDQIFFYCSGEEVTAFDVTKINNEYSDGFYDFELKTSGNKMILSVTDSVN